MIGKLSARWQRCTDPSVWYKWSGVLDKKEYLAILNAIIETSKLKSFLFFSFHTQEQKLAILLKIDYK